MRKFFTFIALVIAVIVLFDITLGVASRHYVKSHRLPGDYEAIDYLIKDADEDIILLGSSVVLNSLMPQVIEDSLNMSCFNGGANGQNLTFFETMLDCVLKRHHPRVIILGLRPDELSGTGIGSRYNLLVPYYKMGYSFVDSCMESKDKFEPYLLKSSLYRLNTIWWRILLYHFITPDERGAKGFIAKSKPLTPPMLTSSKASTDVSAERIGQLKRIVDRCEAEGVKLIIYFPPMYTIIDGTPTGVEITRDICSKHNIPLFYDAQDPYFTRHPEYFHDNVHLDADGARVYSEAFAHNLKRIIQ